MRNSPVQLWRGRDAGARMFELSDGLLVLVSGALGYFGKRWVEDTGGREKVALYATVADLAAKMKASGVSVAEVDTLRTYLLGKRRTVADDAVVALAAPPTGGLDAEPTEFWTQTAMNERADEAYQAAKAELAAVVGELQTECGPAAARELAATQSAWEEFRDRHAEWAASEYEGGSIQPFIRATEADSITRQRLAALRATLDDWRAR